MGSSEPFCVETVLAPIDGSEESAVAVEYAVAIADRYEASMHVLYVLDRGVFRGMDAGTLEDSDVAEITRDDLETVRSQIDQYDIPFVSSVAHGFSHKRKTHHPGSVVLDTAEATDADFIVLPRESTMDASIDALERAAEYVLAYASQPVLSV